jgi:hypothetical protein
MSRAAVIGYQVNPAISGRQALQQRNGQNRRMAHRHRLQAGTSVVYFARFASLTGLMHRAVPLILPGK